MAFNSSTYSNLHDYVLAFSLYNVNNCIRSRVCWFKLIYLRSIAKQVIPTYINHSRPLISDGIHLFFLNEVWQEKGARPVLICWAPNKEASGTIFITSLVWRGRGTNPRPLAHRANALTTEPPLRSRVCEEWVYSKNPLNRILSMPESPRNRTISSVPNFLLLFLMW